MSFFKLQNSYKYFKNEVLYTKAIKNIYIGKLNHIAITEIYNRREIFVIHTFISKLDTLEFL